MKISLRLLLPLCAIIVLMSSCSIQPVTITSVKDVKMNKVDVKGIDMNLGLQVKNPNGIGFKVYKSSLNVKMNGMDMGTVGVDKKFKVRAHSEDVHPVHVSADFANLMSNLGGILSLGVKNNTNMEVTGSIKVGFLFWRKTFPVNVNQSKVPMTH